MASAGVRDAAVMAAGSAMHANTDDLVRVTIDRRWGRILVTIDRRWGRILVRNTRKLFSRKLMGMGLLL